MLQILFNDKKYGFMAAISDDIKRIGDSISNFGNEQIGRDFIAPCLRECVLYRRGTGFFNISALRIYMRAIDGVMENNAKIKILCSPQISAKVHNAIKKVTNDDEREVIIKEYVDKFVEDATGIKKAYKQGYEEQLLSYFIAKGIIDIKFAIPLKDSDREACVYDDDDEPNFDNLEGRNMYHIKDGYFEFERGARVAFKGSANESESALRYNQESFEIFKSWIPEDVKRLERIVKEVDRDHGLLDEKNSDIRLYPIGERILKYLEKHAPKDRPISVSNPTSKKKNDPKKINNGNDKKWKHQDEAVEIFMEKEKGILEMATGSGKTWTSFKIMEKLFEDNLISQIIITMHGNALLAQWENELKSNYKSYEKDQIVYKHFGGEKGEWNLEGFINNPEGNILLISNNKLPDVLKRTNDEKAGKTLIIYDELHNLGSETRMNKTRGHHRKFKYRLGLTATPERKFDEQGTQFLLDEIGDVIFRFPLEEAIKKGILVEFDYEALEYTLSDDEKEKLRKINAILNAPDSNMTKEQAFIKMANVRKEAEDKIPAFRKYLSDNTELLKNSIIFVNSKEYGDQVIEVISQYITDYNTFYDEDNDENLQKLRDGKIQCLITCHRVSEGIDIKALNTVVLFASNVDQRETIQRIGRTLRIDDKLPDKRAFVLDFCDDNAKEGSADEKRFNWLTALSNTKREKNG